MSSTVFLMTMFRLIHSRSVSERPQPLRRLGLPASAPDQLHVTDSEVQQDAAQFLERFREVGGQDGQRVVHGLNVETDPFEIGQAQGEAAAEWLP